jgi:anhydro-N-acetylmuramic acid kinase
LYKLLRKKRPSLGREGFEEWIKPLLDDDSISIEDRLCTVVESVAEAIDDAIPKKKKLQEVLATGGGTHNSFLISRLRERLKDKAEVIVPEKPIVEFKEALVFALLGVLRLRNDVNVLKSVTGAKRDTCSGVLIG